MKLIRDKSTSFGIFGTLALPSGKILHTLELNWKDNQQNISCIPTGEYHCEIVHSPKFGKVYEVKNVPGRTHILIHIGNWVKDTNGCILVGLSRSETMIKNSADALGQLLNEMKNKPFKLEIVDVTNKD